MTATTDTNTTHKAALLSAARPKKQECLSSLSMFCTQEGTLLPQKKKRQGIIQVDGYLTDSSQMRQYPFYPNNITDSPCKDNFGEQWKTGVSSLYLKRIEGNIKNQ